jgi:hypothetical protein
VVDFYSEMMARNWAFISPEEQEKIKNTKILLAGCGLGSVIGLLATQTGFIKFVIADHDIMEISNLNRQAFDRRHLGQNKALALKQILEEKSEAVEVEAHPVKITPENAEEFVSKVDVVVNTVDFDEANYVLTQVAVEQGKPVFSPINLGFTHGFCLVFTPQSTTLEEMTGGKRLEDAQYFMALFGNLKNHRLPEGLTEKFEIIFRLYQEKGAPQTGIGAAITSALVVECIRRVVLDLPVRVAPEVMTIKEVFNFESTEKLGASVP